MMNRISNIPDQDIKLLLQLVTDSKECETRKDFKNLMEALKALIHFESWVANIMTFEKRSTSVYFTIPNLPKLWIAEYIIKAYDQVDPVWLWNFSPETSGDLQVWSETFAAIQSNPDTELVAKQRKFIAASQKYKSLQNGMTIGSNNKRNPSGFLLSICSEDFQHADREKLIFSVLAPFLEQALKQVQIQELGLKLSEQQIKVLDYIQQGLTRKEVAVKLEVAENTVKYHLEQIYSRLKVENQAHAVAKALAKGLIPFR